MFEVSIYSLGLSAPPTERRETSNKYVRRICRKILKITYTKHLALPNVLLNDDEVEKFFEYAAAGLDTFYSELLKPFKDGQRSNEKN